MPGTIQSIERAAAILRDGKGTGPFKAEPGDSAGELRLTRQLGGGDDGEPVSREQVLLGTSPGVDAIRTFADGKADLVLGPIHETSPETAAAVPSEAATISR